MFESKRELENYIPQTALQRLIPGSTFTYNEYDDVKKIAGKKVSEKYLTEMTSYIEI